MRGAATTVPMRRLFLPGGGAFDLPMPAGARIYVKPAPVVTSGAEACPSVLVPVLVGAALGGALTWLLVKLIP